MEIRRKLGSDVRNVGSSRDCSGMSKTITGVMPIRTVGLTPGHRWCGGLRSVKSVVNRSDVQAAINSAAEGDTVIVPEGTCTWTSGVTISGKGIIVQGAGSGRIIAYDNGTETLTIGTGTKTFTIAGYSPGFSASSITAGEARV